MQLISVQRGKFSNYSVSDSDYVCTVQIFKEKKYPPPFNSSQRLMRVFAFNDPNCKPNFQFFKFRYFLKK